jgi:hypothetical protein
MQNNFEKVYCEEGGIMLSRENILDKLLHKIAQKKNV